MDWIPIIALLVVIAILLMKQNQTGINPSSGENKADKKDYTQSYQRKYLLTKNEYREYMKLRQYATEKGLLICPKVRLLDIIEPRKGEKDYKSLFYKVQAKHVDFVICDQDLHIKSILELDDSSHDTAERKERDDFVDQILSSVGYKVIHVRSVTEDTLKGLEEPKQAPDTKQPGPSTVT